MALKLIKKESETPSWMTSTPSVGFIKYVELKAKSPEMRHILLTSESEKERYKTIAKLRQHTLTPEEMERGRKALATGNFTIKSGMTLVQEHAEKLAEKQREVKKPRFDLSSEKYKTVRILKHLGLPIPEKTKKLPIKESYIRTETSIRGMPITEPIFGITIYGKTPKQPKSQSEQIKDFVKSVSIPIIKPTEKLIKPTIKVPTQLEITKQKRDIERKKQSDIKTKAILLEIAKKKEMRSLFGGMFEVPRVIVAPKMIKKVEIEKKKVIRKKKPVEKKFKIIKKYYRKYPKHCVKKQRR